MRITLGQISEGTDGAVITAWHARENDAVEKGQDLLEVATDKATFDVPAPCSGTLTRILKKAGENAGPDEAVAEITEDRTEA